MNNAAMNRGLQISLGGTDFKYSGYTPRSGTAESHDSSILNFLGKLHTVFHKGCTNVDFHQQYHKDSLFSISLLRISLVISCFVFSNSHPNWYEMVYHCGCDLHFPDD